MDRDLERRVDILEGKMELRGDLPGRLSAVESQVVQLHRKLHAGFSALRAEMQAGHDLLRGEMRSGFETLRAEMQAGDNQLRDEMHSGFETLRAEIAETRTHMLVLHEEVLSRLVLIQEGVTSQLRARGRKRR